MGKAKKRGLSLAALALVAAAAAGCDDDELTSDEVCAEKCDAIAACYPEGGNGDGDADAEPNLEECTTSCEGEYADTGDCGDEKLARDHCIYSALVDLDCDMAAAEEACADEVAAYHDCTGPADDQTGA